MTPTPRKRPTRSAIAEALLEGLTMESDSFLATKAVNVPSVLGDLADASKAITKVLGRQADALEALVELLTRHFGPEPPGRPTAYPAADDAWTALKAEREADSRTFHPAAARKPPSAA